VTPFRWSLSMRVPATLMAIAALILPTDGRAEESQFERDIKPLLMLRCGRCHGAESKKAGLQLTELAELLKGGESGSAISVEHPLESVLWERIHDGSMPPEDQPPLTEAEKERIRQWIEGSAASEARAISPKISHHEVLPFLYARCVVCHGRAKQEGGLDLRTVESIHRGGKSGPAVVPGQPERSLLVQRVHSQEMPPAKLLVRAGVRPVETSELKLLRDWITQGAREFPVSTSLTDADTDPLVSEEDRQFWSFRPPVKPDIPSHSREAMQAPIDALLALHPDQGDPSGNTAAGSQTASREPDRRTLIRRVAFDLTGLPPDWSDVERFEEDSSPDWYERMVDFYLASPHYGERWARHWLDLAGYADSEGKRSADPIRNHAWRYRDYVIQAFNSDKSYDRFLLEQLAGDELVDWQNQSEVTPEVTEALIATGFLRMAPDGTGSDVVNTVAERFEVVADEIETLGAGVMGLTLKCAQCHSHKYDPIPQRDYYRLVAVFQGAYDVYDWLKPTAVAGQTDDEAGMVRRYLPNVPTEERIAWQAASQKIDEQLAAAKAELKELEERKPADFAKQKAAIEKRIKDIEAKRPVEPLIRALWDRGQPSPTWLFRRGEFTNPGEPVAPGVLSVLTSGPYRFAAETRPGSSSTGRRLAFARWLTRPDHPLTARVFVNRIWFHHFGKGIVQSLGNFGRTGTPPTHPELLDWLAVSFVENGWSTKWLHRQILCSTAWKNSGLRRLDAETLYDSLLSVADVLDRRAFGSPDPVTVREDGLVTPQRTPGGWRRAVYVLQRRKEIATIFETFDLPQMNPNCLERPSSTVASQALFLMNNGMIRDLSLELAKRVEREAGPSPALQIERLYQIALSRWPDEEERQASLKTLEQLTEEWTKAAPANAAPKTSALSSLCHVLLNSAEFLFVD